MNSFISKSGKNIILRNPTTKDVQIMLDFINELGQEDIYLNANPDDPYTYEQEEWFVKESITKIKNNQKIHFLAFHNQELIGSCTIEKQTLRRKHIGVYGITIAKNFREDGIGKQLTKIAILKAKEILKINIIILDVYAPNLPAQNLYKQLGFKEYGLLPGGLSYKNEFIDQILMYKKI